MGDKRFLNELYSEEILCCEEKKLSKDIEIETTIYSLKGEKKEYKNYWKNQIYIFKNGEIIDLKTKVEQNYFIFDNLKDALDKKLIMIELLKESLINKITRDIDKFIEELKNNIKVIENK